MGDVYRREVAMTKSFLSSALIVGVLVAAVATSRSDVAATSASAPAQTPAPPDPEAITGTAVEPLPGVGVALLRHADSNPRLTEPLDVRKAIMLTTPVRGVN